MFAEDKSLSRERICEKTGLSDGTIKREIAFLKKSGYLNVSGALKRNRIYYIVETTHFFVSIVCVNNGGSELSLQPFPLFGG